jgi:hypothetical protein
MTDHCGNQSILDVEYKPAWRRGEDWMLFQGLGQTCDYMISLNNWCSKLPLFSSSRVDSMHKGNCKEKCATNAPEGHLDAGIFLFASAAEWVACV